MLLTSRSKRCLRTQDWSDGGLPGGCDTCILFWGDDGREEVVWKRDMEVAGLESRFL